MVSEQRPEPGHEAGGGGAAGAPGAVRRGHAQNFERLNRQLAGSGYERHLRFLNFGYEALEGEAVPGPALPVAFPNKDSARLVFAVVGDTDLAGARLLDVGCGRGGNVWLLSRTYDLAFAAGLDLTPSSVAFAATTVAADRAGFVAGDAERLPFGADRFDAVTNVESSCCYPDIEAFYREVARVLRPGGAFLYTDLFPRPALGACRQALVDLGFEVEHERDITANVARSRATRAARQKQAFGDVGGALGYDEWVGEEGSALHDTLVDGTGAYVVLRLRHAGGAPPADRVLEPGAAAELRAGAERAVEVLTVRDAG